jgi:hypothetical protein
MRLLGLLKEAPPEGVSQGLDSVDPRLSELTGHYEAKRFAEVAQSVEALLEAGVWDLRPISLYLAVAFEQQGIAGLSEVLATWATIIGPSLPSIGPAVRREDYASKRTSALLGTIGDALHYHETKRTETWAAWAKVMTPTMNDAIVAATDDIDKAIVAASGAAPPSLAQFIARLRSVLRALAAPTDAAPTSLSSASVALPAPVEAAAPAEEGVATPAPVTKPGRVEVAVSPAYFDLIEKLNAFAVLARKGEMMKAAVVADDLMSIIDHFDPRDYFPLIFSEFGELMSQNIERISSSWESRNSLAWKALVQFYRVDRRRFTGS